MLGTGRIRSKESLQQSGQQYTIDGMDYTVCCGHIRDDDGRHSTLIVCQDTTSLLHKAFIEHADLLGCQHIF